MVAIHDAARRKYDRGDFEPEGAGRIMVHRRNLLKSLHPLPM